MAGPPRVSVIVPVYGVAQYLPACLDSILTPDDDTRDGDPRDGDTRDGDTRDGDTRDGDTRDGDELDRQIEVIAVDDASPDGSGAILDRRAAADPRLQVIHLDRNGGQGSARNLALGRARGDYVWFADGDDTLAAGALAAIGAALAQTKPDVLLINWESQYPGGRTEPNVYAPLLAAVPAGGCTLEEQPQLINLTMTSWSKLFRREFLTGLDVGFGAGIHEDILVTCAALLNADVIGAVGRVCYRYRRQRPGAAMSTTSSGQAAVFEAYHRVFELLAERAAAGQPASASLQAAIFERAIEHYSTVLETTGVGVGRIGLPGLVPRADRKQWFARMHADFGRYRPAGYHHPAGPRGAKLRLVERGAYGTYSLLEPLNQARVALRRLGRSR
jgi:CDP-glycerol glycerophosphotransferase